MEEKARGDENGVETCTCYICKQQKVIVIDLIDFAQINYK